YGNDKSRQPAGSYGRSPFPNIHIRSGESSPRRHCRSPGNHRRVRADERVVVPIRRRGRTDTTPPARRHPHHPAVRAARGRSHRSPHRREVGGAMSHQAGPRDTELRDKIAEALSGADPEDLWDQAEEVIRELGLTMETNAAVEGPRHMRRIISEWEWE